MNQRVREVDPRLTREQLHQIALDLDRGKVIRELGQVVKGDQGIECNEFDPALLRPGRFDLVIELPMPDERARYEIFKVHTKEKPITKDISLEELAKMTEGFTGADIEAVCNRAAILAIRKFDEKHNDISSFAIKYEHLKLAIEEVMK